MQDIEGKKLVGTNVTAEVGSSSETAALDTARLLRESLQRSIASGNLNEAVPLAEQLRSQEFENYFGEKLPVNTELSVSTAAIASTLGTLANQTGKTPAILYIFAQPEQLQLVLVTPESKPVLRTVPEANRAALLKEADAFLNQVTNPIKKNTKTYLASSQKLYRWLIAPLEESLRSRGTDTLVFSLDKGLRSLPLAALHDGKQFLVEKYSIGLIPSLNLVDTRYKSLRNSQVLAFGASQFNSQDSLPAVPVELSTITGQLWTGKSFLNEAFTLKNLKVQREQQPFEIVHLATHGEFKPGKPNKSYLQLWNEQLKLNQLRELRLHNPPVELLVLSACRSALGDETAELGFGGLAVAAGVKSALASLWYVSDAGTLGLITEFYQNLKTAPIKAEALRQAQIAMIRGEMRVEKGRLYGIASAADGVPLSPELADLSEPNLSHPYFWAAFTMIGSPW